MRADFRNFRNFHSVESKNWQFSHCLFYLLSSCILAKFWTSPRSFNRWDIEESDVLDSLSSKSLSWEELLDPLTTAPGEISKVALFGELLTSNVALWQFCVRFGEFVMVAFGGGDNFWYVELRPALIGGVPPLLKVEFRPLLNVEFKPRVSLKPVKKMKTF